MHFSGAFKRSSAIIPKLAIHVGPSSTLADVLSPFVTRSTAAPSVRLRVFMSGSTSASEERRGC